ncbi:unnamed protein product [Clavelina lepadiformis]|uniref:DOMON domain-containing protein n=1 Tax=Clavelina lepadiformis TaxID=159417 RepID=A0ABP0FV82_CLALP
MLIVKNPSFDPELAIEESLESNIEAKCIHGPSTTGGEPEPHDETDKTNVATPTSIASPTNSGDNDALAWLTRFGDKPTHLMDCTDIVIGSVKGDLHRVQDMYTRDRSTPREDRFYDGTEDLTGSAGSQIDGLTTIVFRRKLEASHPSDHAIINGQMTVIWAMGQGIDMYQHAPNTGLEDCTASDYRFYRHDEIKYHGTGPNRRGGTSFNFFESHKLALPAPTDSCNTMSGEYRLPRNCIASDDASFSCDYFVIWQLNSTNDKITFVLKSKQDQSRWIGLGISSDQLMANTDVITAWIDQSGNPVVKDRYATGYSPPGIDNSGDIESITGSYENGVMTIQFTRSRNTQDSFDIAFSDTECQHMIYATGQLNSAGDDIRKHDNTPIVSSNKICIRSCDIKVKKEITLQGDLRLVANFTAELNDPNTQAYKDLAQEMEQVIQATFEESDFIKNSDGNTVEIKVTGFKEGSVIVEYTASIQYEDTGSDVAEVRSNISDSFQAVVASNGGKLINSSEDVEVSDLTEFSPIVADSTTTTTTATTAAITTTKRSESSAALEDWKIAVICVCVMGGVVLIFGLITFCLKRRKNQQFESLPMQHNGDSDGHTNEAMEPEKKSLKQKLDV